MRKKITLCQEQNLSIETAFLKFLNEKRASNKADDTLSYYESRFNYFNDFLQLNGINNTDELEQDLIIDYINYTKERNPEIRSVTINNYLRAVRCILYYFMEKGYTKNFSIKLISTDKKPKEGYTLEEQKKLIKKPDMKTCTFVEYRNWVMVCHLFASGNRSRTLRFIKIKHVNLNERVILLDKVKNRISYEIPISNEYYSIINEYMQVRKGEPDEFLFCTQYGTQMTADGLRTIIKKYNISRGVTRYSLHLFRNVFAKTWILAGGSPKKLQKALGHSTPAMVDEYLCIYGRELEEDFSKFTPLSSLKNDIQKEKVRMK